MEISEFGQLLRQLWREKLLIAGVYLSTWQVLAIVGLAVLILAAAAVLWFRDQPKPVTIQTARRLPEAKVTAVTVHVCGQVRRPGVYTLAAGKRVNDAVNRAGGSTERADLAALNLAAHVRDGERIYVPARGESLVQASGAGGGGGLGMGSEALLDLNQATVQQLEELPGIGPVLAERIVEYRTRHGPFSRVEQVQQVDGIGPKKFEQLRERVVVN